MQSGETLRSIRLEKSRLEFYSRDQRGNDVDHFATKGPDRRGDSLATSRESIQKPRGQLLGTRIDPDENRVALVPDRPDQMVRKVHVLQLLIGLGLTDSKAILQ